MGKSTPTIRLNTILWFVLLITPMIIAVLNEEFSKTIFKVYALGIVIGSIAISIWSDILKDVFINNEVQSKTKTYSFSRVQGMWWTVIIGFCYTWSFSVTGVSKITNLNPTCLTLLGIGISTTLIGSLIDTTDTEKGKSRYQDEINSQGFFWDILCDGKTVTVHRFQALIFNVVFGVVFLISFFDKYEFPEFSPITLGLLGISISTYLTMKATSENNNSKTNSPKTTFQNQKEAINSAEIAESELLESLK